MGLCHMLALVLVFSAIDAARTRKESTSTDCSAVGCSHSCETVVELVPPQCTCPADMTLARDDKTCTVTHFLLAMFRAIKLFKGEDDAVIAPVKARCLDYHYDRREVYAYTNKTIIRYSYGRKIALPAHIVTRPETAVTSLAVDWHNDLVYYIADQQSVVYVISREEADSREVLSHNNSDISPGWRELRVDPYSKLLFWVGDSGVYRYSEQSNMLSHDIFFGWLRPVDSISLDVTEGMIYAIGRRNNSTNKFIISTNYRDPMGKGVNTVELDFPATMDIYGFTVIGKTAYWESNHDGENIYKCNLETEKTPVSPVVVAELNQIVYDMKIVHKDIQTSSLHGN